VLDKPEHAGRAWLVAAPTRCGSSREHALGCRFGFSRHHRPRFAESFGQLLQQLMVRSGIAVRHLIDLAGRPTPKWWVDLRLRGARRRLQLSVEVDAFAETCC